MSKSQIATGGIADDAVTSAKTELGLITMVDQWRLTTDFTASDTNANNITANLERVDTSGQGTLGTGMTESSGKFTFPSTGIYLVRAFGQFELNGDSRYNVIGIRLTTNNSDYSGVAQGNVFIQQTRSAGTSSEGVAETIVDVTNTTNVNIYFYTQIDNGATVKGSSTTNSTAFTFIRLGDT
tara:strand:+ start:4 stop:549 length:546 start_codon:yes stop_codon:yes gene_type:complete